MKQLLPGKHDMQGHSLASACNRHIKQGKHQNAKQPTSREVFERKE